MHPLNVGGVERTSYGKVSRVLVRKRVAKRQKMRFQSAVSREQLWQICSVSAGVNRNFDCVFGQQSARVSQRQRQSDHFRGFYIRKSDVNAFYIHQSQFRDWWDPDFASGVLPEVPVQRASDGNLLATGGDAQTDGKIIATGSGIVGYFRNNNDVGVDGWEDIRKNPWIAVQVH